MKFLTGAAVAAALVVSAAAANAQAPAGAGARYMAASDLEGPSYGPYAEPELPAPPPRYGYGFTQARGTQRVFVGRIGPFGYGLLLLVLGLLGAVLLLAIIGAALIWIPVVAVLVVIAAVSGVLRRL